MTRPLALAVLTALAFAACDGGFSDSPDGFACVDGASVTATAAGDPYAAECVEVSRTSSGLTVRSYVNPNTDRDETQRSLEFLVERVAVGTYPVSGATFLTYSTSPIVAGVPTSTTLVASGTGQVAITESTASRVRGTFSFTGREETTPAGGTSPTSGETVSVTGSFDVPL
ncbi:MAG TPA: DUF6252 family protein [Rubricoccaceae bacterium]|jgi:hypothetical protein